MKNKVFYHAFRTKYPGLVREIFTDIKVCKASSTSKEKNDPKNYRAIWDTGATGSVITKKAADELGLIPFSKTKVLGVNSTEICNLYLVDIFLPNIGIKDVQIIECKINAPHYDILIGMDIIQVGDLSISNYENKTLFSFCVPPHKNRVDLYERSITINPKPKKL